MRRKYYFLIITLSTVVLIACNRFVQVDVPPNQLSAATVFTDAASARSVLAGIYGELSTPTQPLSAYMHLAMSLNADELEYTASRVQYVQFAGSSILPDNSYVSALWDYTYSAIYQANLVLVGLETSPIADPERLQMLGEARFIRAFCYFYLANLYGDVPLIVGTDYLSNQSTARTNADNVYQQVLEDLMEAKQLLSDQNYSAERIIPTKEAAEALLARVYLYRKQWADAEKESTELIESERYRLAALEDVFLKESEETIWQLMPVFPRQNTGYAYQTIPSSLTNNASPSFILSAAVRKGFDEGDGRKEAWLGQKMVNEEALYFPYKYKVRLNEVLTEYLVVLRLAEQYLIRAESRAQMGKLDESLEDLNALRNRAGLPNLELDTQEEVLAAVEKERQLELAFEWGHRWFDLKRNGKLDETLAGLKGAEWQSTDSLWPIPFAQLESNPFLSQNPGY